MKVEGANRRPRPGDPVLRLFPWLCRLRSKIADLRFASYLRGDHVDDRLKRISHCERTLIGTAECIKEEHGVPFWVALLSKVTKDGISAGGMPEAAMVHEHSPQEREFHLPSGNVSFKSLREVIQHLPAQHGLLACSRVRLLSGQVLHIPMMDMLAPHCSKNEMVICHSMRLVAQRLSVPEDSEGVLVRTKNSYHFYGTFLLNTDDWMRFMAQSLLLSPITDPRYIAHRLLDQECCLGIAYSKNLEGPAIARVFRIHS